MGLNVSIKMHFCSIRAKDYYQLKSRYLRRARTIKLPHEEITKEGLLMYAQIEGKRENLTKINDLLINQLKIQKKSVVFDEDTIKMPYRMVLSKKFMSLLKEYDLNCNIIEIIPFREKDYFQITESTPINVFIQELDSHEN
jgi:pyruvate formate-lyase activating enzyme-like uncharacterized protein